MTNEDYIKTHPEQFKDDIDKWLFMEFGIIGGCCSSIESLKYIIAKEVAEKLTYAFIEKAAEWLKNDTYGYLIEKWGETDIDREKLVEDFKKYMKGE